MDDPREISKIQHSILSEDGTLKYDFMTSLQKIAMAKIVSSLWMDQNTLQKIMDLFRKHAVDWSRYWNIEKDIVAKVSELSLPNSVCQELTDLVSVLGNFIRGWVEYHDRYIFDTNKSNYSAVHLIHNITWTARGKIDYLQTAKNIVASSAWEDNVLSLDHKYKLACTYCLEDRIDLLSSELVNIHGTRNNYLSNIEIDSHPMVYFWTNHITGDGIQLNNDDNRHIGDMSIYEYVIWSYPTCSRDNEVPLRFLWNKLVKEKNYEYITVFKYVLFKCVKNPDFMISVLSNLDYDQQRNILKECSYQVLEAILEHWWWWGTYFLATALNVMDNMDAETFWKVLCEINMTKRRYSEKNMYDHFKSLFKWLRHERSRRLNKLVFPTTIRALEGFVLEQLNWERDMDVIEVILKDLNTQQKRNIAFNSFAIPQCAHFIKGDKWDVLDFFIKCTLSSEEDISKLKQRLIRDEGREIALHFSRQREFLKLQRFMNWAFKSEEAINNFCQSLAIPPPSLRQSPSLRSWCCRLL